MLYPASAQLQVFSKQVLSRELLSHMFEPGPGGQPPRVLACARWHAYPRCGVRTAEDSNRRTDTGPQPVPLRSVVPTDSPGDVGVPYATSRLRYPNHTATKPSSCHIFRPDVGLNGRLRG